MQQKKLIINNLKYNTKMKKAFKLFAMALVAGAMMVACDPNDDPINPNDSTPGNNGDDNTPDTPLVEGVKATFGAVAWDAASVQAYNYQSGLYFYAFSNADEQTFPIVMCYATQVTPGELTDTFDESTMGYTNGKIGSLDYYEEYALSDGQGGSYGDWWAESATAKINSYDATSLLIDADINANMFSALEAFVADFGQVGMAAATHKNLTVDFCWTLTMYTGK